MKKSCVSMASIVCMSILVSAPTAFAQTTATEAKNTPVDIVKIDGGQVKGVPTDVPGVQVFKGLPYAASTTGANRFRVAQPVQPWGGVKLADKWGDQAMQDVNLNPVGMFWGDEFYFDKEFMPPASENGLNLNVFTPAQSIEDKLPVYVWVHGGGNDHGYASEIEFYASKLAAKGIIVVPVQYRVGPFGFLSLEELSKESPDGTSGNYAIKDLVTALRWVKKNIGGFGGDCSNVTIGGQSAGSRNVNMLLRTPAARGLFHRVVLQSASGGLLATDFPTMEEKTKTNGEAITKIFGKPMSVAELRQVPAEEFISRKVDEKTSLFYALHKTIGSFVIDGTLLTRESVNLLRPGALDGIDIMIGSNADERTSTVGIPAGKMDEPQFTSAMDKYYGSGWQAAYRPTDPQNAYRLKLRSEADNLLQTALISAQYAKNHNKNANTYVYYFNHDLPGRDNEFYGSFHSSDLWYFMNSLRDKPGHRPWTDADYRMAETMSTYLANFVKTGSPTAAGQPQWPQPVDGPAFMRFADGYAYPVNTTPYPLRDAVNRQQVLKTYALSEETVSGKK
ncbi:Carboxylesterase type B [Agrobacterium fabacearum S56]|uniref:carboxylesterase/lipase family protein n=1 Tax=Agrobacterium tumefaciens TaxID=358 RepID=UPI0009BBE763|nr:carboxylesterase family protein [Agrobacterium tumefaciens]CUX06860.1 Carboxylesterase type B [Agrobacterium fabacearum S56]